MRTQFWHRLSITSLAIADLVYVSEKVYMITRLSVPTLFNDEGHASGMLKRASYEADLNGVTLIAVPSPSGHLGLTALINWYTRAGFSPAPEGTFDSSLGCVLRREPQDPTKPYVREKLNKTFEVSFEDKEPIAVFSGPQAKLHAAMFSGTLLELAHADRTPTP